MRKYTALVAGLALLAAPAICAAAPVTMTAGDGFGTSSFNTAGQWDSAAAPTAGNDYFNAGNLLRTPAGSGGIHTFAGDSLTITGGGIATSLGNDALMYKGGGLGIITVGNLIVDGGQLRHGSGDGDTFQLEGNLTIGANGANVGLQGPVPVNASVHGDSLIRILDSGSSSGSRLLTFGSTANTYTGNLELYGNDSYRARFQLADDANLNFVIGASGANNSIFGTGTAYLDGDLFFDLSGAGTTVGDSWLIEGVSRKFYGATFTVNGFSDQGDDTWFLDNGSAEYLFSEADGTLTVIPEPSTLALLGLAGIALAARRRARA